MKANKILKIAGIGLLASFGMLVSALLVTNWRFPMQSYGRLVFADTFSDGNDVDKIEIMSDGSLVTLEHNGEYWYVKEADDYHTNIVLLNNILLNFNNATYYAKRKFSAELQKELGLSENGVRIKTFAKDKKLNDIVVGQQAKNKNFWYIKPFDKNEIWLVDGNFLLPREFYSWIMQPVLEFPEDMVKAIKSEGEEIRRPVPRAGFVGSDNLPVPIVSILKVANYILAENVKKIDNFDKATYSKHKKIEFLMFGGLIITYDIYSDGESFWMTIDLKSIPLPKKEVNAYIKANKLFYDGWIFKLPDVIGGALFEASLK